MVADIIIGPRTFDSYVQTAMRNYRRAVEKIKVEFRTPQNMGSSELSAEITLRMRQFSRKVCQGRVKLERSPIGVASGADPVAVIKNAISNFRFSPETDANMRETHTAMPYAVRQMLTDYIREAMRLAHYELMENGRFFATIPSLKGLWAEDVTLEACREELQSTLEDWIMIKVRFGDKDFPVLNGIDLNPKPEYAEAD